MTCPKCKCCGNWNQLYQTSQDHFFSTTTKITYRNNSTNNIVLGDSENDHTVFKVQCHSLHKLYHIKGKPQIMKSVEQQSTIKLQTKKI